ncbi:MAG: sulfatase [Planctomycetota bacterium]
MTLSSIGRADQPKPNVLFIISDDLNTALSGMGHPECRTPHLDEFAKSGVTFRRAYCQFPLCGPSRASIMTGQYPLVTGVTGNGGDVDPLRVTLPRHFANHGYWTARVSKIYHMGIPGDIVEGKSGRDHSASWQETYNIAAMEAMTPGKARDFTQPDSVAVFPTERRKWLAAQSSGMPYSFTKLTRAQYAAIEVDDENEHLLADKMAVDRAIELLQTRAKQTEPFFLAVGLVRPHFPFIATTQTIGQYQTDKMLVPQVPSGDHDDIPPQSMGAVLRFERSPIQQMRRAYYGAVSFMDRQVGRILASLDRLQLRENTIVIFVSDHGYLLGEHHMWKKSKLWEEVIRVPMIISAPGLKGNVSCNHFVELVDLYPTLTDLAGLPSDFAVQGHSLVPLLQDPTVALPRRDALTQVSGGFGLRDGHWAYMWYPATRKHPEEGVMLYDMERDPHQLQNLADDPTLARKRKALHQRLIERIERAKRVGAAGPDRLSAVQRSPSIEHGR